MRTREKERIFKRFMGGQSINGISMEMLVRRDKMAITYDDILSMRRRVEQAIREAKRKDGVE